VAQPDLAAVATGCKLKPAKGIRGHGVGLDAEYVAEDDIGAALAQQRTDAVRQPGKVVPGNRAAKGEVDCLRR
jgi:hypothetical protein